MIVEKNTGNGLLERRSDRGVYIKNEQTGFEYEVAVDIENEQREKQGLTAYSYVETERVIRR